MLIIINIKLIVIFVSNFTEHVWFRKNLKFCAGTFVYVQYFKWVYL
jgi:hypothetical protein